jgi:hypothetical protein
MEYSKETILNFEDWKKGALDYVKIKAENQKVNNRFVDDETALYIAELEGKIKTEMQLHLDWKNVAIKRQ